MVTKQEIIDIIDIIEREYFAAGGNLTDEEFAGAHHLYFEIMKSISELPDVSPGDEAGPIFQNARAHLDILKKYIDDLERLNNESQTSC